MKKRYVILSWYPNAKSRSALRMAGIIDANGKAKKNISEFLNHTVLQRLMGDKYQLSAKAIQLEVLGVMKIDLAKKFNEIREKIQELNEEIGELENAN